MKSIVRKSAICLFALCSILLFVSDSASAQTTCQTTNGGTGSPMAVLQRTSPEWLSNVTSSFRKKVPPGTSVQPCVPDTTPDSFTLMNGLICASWDGTNKAPRTLTTTSSVVTPKGYNSISTASASTTGIGKSTISVNNGPWVTSANISPGQSIRIRTQVTVPNTVATYDMTAHLTIGGMKVNRAVRFKVFKSGSCP
jgi:hypothetical protein